MYQLITAPSTFPTVATNTSHIIGFLPAIRSPTKTTSDCMGTSVAAINAEIKRVAYDIILSPRPHSPLCNSAPKLLQQQLKS
jgi:hypothetical protein